MILFDKGDCVLGADREIIWRSTAEIIAFATFVEDQSMKLSSVFRIPIDNKKVLVEDDNKRSILGATKVVGGDNRIFSALERMVIKTLILIFDLLVEGAFGVKMRVLAAMEG